ncbi:aminoglycoside phosphotransferase family protein [Accumulibacter sp.]|uniref:aminoglycoside phosphotransferase family protein n=1 Tax=Accumulibacter sp. TaxID=2053492 RepID=UPI0026011311|nr:aminoglycoside phosphotransferase family protein [Accumulibacter sp.]MCM8613614.1 aminoglycoside phosphotransferase family protein [Accumulibacter sp.]MCM8637358.1 aminoglycoside phosphotransferase family protein [Accumulibacter sp.]MCM8638964.1 aminoglycoside phosphotransferase family protein [Accumulibacter sp.]
MTIHRNSRDYLFAWRWLLPFRADGPLSFSGLSDADTAWWRSAEGQAPDSPTMSTPTCGLIALVDYAMPAPGDLAGLNWLCAWGNHRQVTKFRASLPTQFVSIREYGLLPAGNPRVVVPLTSARHAVMALSLHRPGRRVARMGVMLARTLARFGYLDLLRGRVLLIATKSPGFVQHGAVLAGVPARVGRQVTDYALYLGTPDDNRKTVVLPLGDELPSVILKVAETPRACASLHNEAAALSALSGSLISGSVPRLVDLVSSDAAITLYQEYRPRRRISARKLDESVAEFLGQLAMVELETVPLADYLAHVSECMDETMPGEVLHACRDLHDRLQKLAESAQVIHRHRTHGDFAPWNCAWTDQGLYVFDWEASMVNGLALGDAFYYAIAPVLLMKRNAKAETALAKALHMGETLAKKMATVSGVLPDPQLYLALWLLGRQDKTGLYGELLVLLARSWR